MDPGDRQQLAARYLDADFFVGRAVYIDEFDTFNAPKRALLAAMLPVTDVTVCLCCDGMQDRDGGMGLFSGAKAVAASLRRMAAQAGVPVQIETLTDDPRHAGTPVLAELNLLLADPTYTPQVTVDPDHPAIVCHGAASRQAEAKAVAAQIAARARAGTPYGRMAVVCRNMAEYLGPLRYEFRLQGIPLFCDEATTPENTAPARAVHAALDLARTGVSSRTVLRLLKTGLVDLPERQQAALENYAYTWPLKAADWREPFTRSAAGYADREQEEDGRTLQYAEAARAFVMERVQQFLARTKNAGAEVLTRQIYRFLQALGAEKTLDALAGDLRARGRLPEADEALREWNVVMGLLNQLAQLLGDEPLPPAEYAELFTLLLRTTDMGHIPQSLDSVILTTAGRMRLPETDAVFVVGLVEGEFPQTPGDQGLLTHADRDAMMAQGAELPDCFENKVLREGVCFYKALTAARSFLWLSWPGAAHTQDDARASAALNPVRSLLRVPFTEPSAAMLAATPEAALDILGVVSQQPGREGEGAALRAALDRLEGTSQAAPGYEAVRRVWQTEPPGVEDTAELEKLLGRSLRVSPTRFEKYQTCPFGYFMQFILRAAPRQKAELAPNISGTLTHWVLENALKRQGAAFRDLTGEQLQALVDGLVEEYAAANLPGITARMQYLIERIRRNLVGLLGFIQRDLRQSGFQPVAFELRIDDRPGGDPGAPRVDPVELDDGCGHTIRIVGTVDRVDAMPLGERTYLRVVDYKTGGKDFQLKEVYCGLDCQMLLYLFTLERNGRGLFPGAAAAGVEYLLADPAPESVPRAQAGQGEENRYPLNGLLLDEESVYRAMDTKGTGEFVPLNFNAKTGKVTNGKSRLADGKKLARIRDHLDGLLVQMSRDVYGGRFDAKPLCSGGRSPCAYCDFRIACAHRDGENERTVDIPGDPFEE